MHQTKITTNRIEEVLLKKKQEEFKNDVAQALGVLNTTLYKYTSGMIDAESQSFSSWLTTKAIVPVPMNNRRTSAISCNLHSDHYPDALNLVLLKQAVDEFIRSVESTKEVIDRLEY